MNTTNNNGNGPLLNSFEYLTPLLRSIFGSTLDTFLYLRVYVNTNNPRSSRSVQVVETSVYSGLRVFLDRTTNYETEVVEL